MTKTFIFPQGGGGAWLSNLIHNLETGKMEVPTCQVDFDASQACAALDLPPSSGWRRCEPSDYMLMMTSQMR